MCLNTIAMHDKPNVANKCILISYLRIQKIFSIAKMVEKVLIQYYEEGMVKNALDCCTIGGAVARVQSLAKHFGILYIP